MSDNLYELKDTYSYLNNENNGMSEICNHLVKSVLDGGKHSIYDYQVLVLMLKIYGYMQSPIKDNLLTSTRECRNLEEYLEHLISYEHTDLVFDSLIKDRSNIVFGGVAESGQVPFSSCFGTLNKCIEQVQFGNLTMGNISFILCFSYLKSGKAFDEVFKVIDSGTLHRLIYIFAMMNQSVSDVLMFYEGDNNPKIKSVIKDISDWIHDRMEEVRDMGYLLW